VNESVAAKFRVHDPLFRGVYLRKSCGDGMYIGREGVGRRMSNQIRRPSHPDAEDDYLVSAQLGRLRVGWVAVFMCFICTTIWSASGLRELSVFASLFPSLACIDSSHFCLFFTSLCNESTS
jgi:hypothetical protein